jgi:hypothetical protein
MGFEMVSEDFVLFELFFADVTLEDLAVRPVLCLDVSFVGGALLVDDVAFGASGSMK